MHKNEKQSKSTHRFQAKKKHIRKENSIINRFLSLFFKIKKTIVTETGLTIVQTFERDKITTEHFKQNKLIYKTINM